MNCIIIEDEKNASERLRKLIQTHLPYLHIEAIIGSVQKSIAYLTTNEAPSVIFMDVHLSDGLAFSIFDQIEVSAPVIFTTAYSEFAIKAYKTSAIDYLLKPIKKDELVLAMSKLSYHKSKMLKWQGKEMCKELTFIVRFGNRYYMSQIDDLAYIEETENLTIITRKDKLQFPINISISEIVQDLPAHKFAQISKRMIINIDAIKNLEYHSKIPFILLEPGLGSKVKVDKNYVNSFNSWLHQQYA